MSVQSPTIDPVAVFATLGHPLRRQLMRMVSDGRTISEPEAAAVVHRDVYAVLKQLRVLRDAGFVRVIVW
jgi:predicted transcriptional regulator